MVKTKLFELEVKNGITSCDVCDFKNSKYACGYLKNSGLCQEYDFSDIRLKDSSKDIIRFGELVPNKEMIGLLSQYPDNSLISVECCSPRTMRYDEKDNLIRID